MRMLSSGSITSRTFAIFLIAILMIEMSGKSVHGSGQRFKRMKGSVIAKPDEFKYVVSIWYAKTAGNAGSLVGGGSIISNRFILTAAYCVDRDDVSRLSVVSGIGNSGTLDGEIHAIKEAIKHPDYRAANDNTLATNDIALILLQEPINFELMSGALQQIYLPYYQVKNDESCTIACVTSTEKQPHPYLSKMEQKLVDLEECMAPKTTINVEPDINFKCLFGRHGYIITQTTDIGNALVHDGYIVGIVSDSHQLRRGATIYTNVYSYNKWIFEEISKAYKNSPNAPVG